MTQILRFTGSVSQARRNFRTVSLQECQHEWTPLPRPPPVHRHARAEAVERWKSGQPGVDAGEIH